MELRAKIIRWKIRLKNPKYARKEKVPVKNSKKATDKNPLLKVVIVLI
jgi:hypothetical protein